MTFCVGMKTADGVVGIADTRVTSGAECVMAKKLAIFHHGGHPLFVMTSGLRSVRDKALTYFEEALDESEGGIDRLYKAVNVLTAQTRRVASEDRQALEANNLHFNFYALVGGQLAHDKEHKLYLLYPEGNWVEIGAGTPYCIIGETGYGKPILDRTLKYGDSMHFALKVGTLAFDSTRISSTNVDFPIDIVMYEKDSREMTEHRFEKTDLVETSSWWQEQLRDSLTRLPAPWLDRMFCESGNASTRRTIPLQSGDVS